LSLIFFIVALLLAANAEATTRYVSPSGVGSTCSSPSPCPAATGIAATIAGDTLIFKDGNYVGLTINPTAHGTVNSRIIYQAENRHLAVIQSSAGTRGLIIDKDYYTIRGFTFDGRSGLSGFTSLISSAAGAGNTVDGLIIEDNRIIDSDRAAIQLSGPVNGCTVRYNLVDGTGYGSSISLGEAFYLSSATATNTWATVSNCTFYGNTTRDTTNNMIDFKRFTSNINFHHNLFETNVLRSARGTPTTGADDGLIRSEGSITTSGNIFQRNIVRDSASAYIIRTDDTRVDVLNNVFYNLTATTADLIDSRTGPAATIFGGNKLCNTVDDIEASVVQSPANLLNQNQSVCDDEEDEIIAEVAARPVIATAEVGLIAADKIRITLTNESLAALDGAAIYGDADLISAVDITKFTCTAVASRICVDGAPVTISGAAVVGTNIIELTLGSSVTVGQAVLLNGSAAAITNTGVIGATWISDLSSSAAFTNQAVTNNVEGAAPSHVLDQKTFQFYGVRTSGGLLTKLPHTAAALNTNIRTVPGGSVILAIQIDGTVANPPPIAVLPYYQKNGAGGYAAVPGSFGADNIRIGTAQTGADVPAAGEAISTCLTGALTVVNGLQVNSANAVPTFDLTQDDCIVNRWSIEFDTDVVAGDYYEIRLYNQDTNALDTYTVTPRIDIISDRAGGGT
jgi:hypothetical protein